MDFPVDPIIGPVGTREPSPTALALGFNGSPRKVVEFEKDCSFVL